MSSRWLSIALIFYLLLGVLFLIAPNNGFDSNPIPLRPDLELTKQTWIYYFCEHLATVLLSFCLYRVTRYEIAKVFVLIQVIDIIDYVITYNSVWFHFGSVEFSCNTFKMIVLSLFIVKNELFE
jgi:hypothetical protein